jgi:hypothetical protein
LQRRPFSYWASLLPLHGLSPQGPQLSPAKLETFNGCGMDGDATNPAVRALNRLKNRYTATGTGEINSTITLAAILAPGNDVGRWKMKYGAEIVGYYVKAGRVESVGVVGASAEQEISESIGGRGCDQSSSCPRNTGSRNRRLTIRNQVLSPDAPT